MPDRFKAPVAADEMADCQGICGQRFHYTALDRNGLCFDCRPEKVDDGEANGVESDRPNEK